LSVDAYGHPTNWTTRSLTAGNIGAEPAFSKNTAFNKNFGTSAGTVMQGDGAYSKSESDSRYLRTTGGGLSGTLVLNDNVQLRLGTTAEAGSWGLKIQGGANNNTLFDMGQDILFRDNNGFDTRFIFRRSTGSFTASGNINANVGVFGGSSSASPLSLLGNGSGVANSNYIQFFESNGTTRQGYLGFPSSTSDSFEIMNQRGNNSLILDQSGGVNGLRYYDGVLTRTVYHSGNLTLSTLGG